MVVVSIFANGRKFGIIAALLAIAAIASAQTPLSLEEAARRQLPTFEPAHNGENVVLEGTVAVAPVRIRDYTHSILHDSKGFGFTLEWLGTPAVIINAGDLVRAVGEIGNRAGLVILRVESIEKTGSATPPEPAVLNATDLNGFRHVGRFVQTEAFVLSSGQNAGGDILLIGERSSNVAVFLPRASAGTDGLRNYQPGDKVRVKGISSQYCPVEPYDRGFQIVVIDAAAVTLLNRGWVVPADMLIYIGCVILGIFGIFWFREREDAAHRRVMRRMMTLSEELLTTTTPVEVARNVESALPPLLGPSTVAIYVFNRGSKTLERIATDGASERSSLDVDAPIGDPVAAAALCFRNRALLEIPNTRKSPLIAGPVSKDDPQGALFVPLFAQNEPIGVIALHYRRKAHRLSADQRTAMQHLGNLIAASLRLQEQRWMRDQLLRSEKMAAAGQLISGVANDLREPFSTISDAVRKALDSGAPTRTALQDIDHAARHGVEIVQHLLAFSRMDRSEPRPLDVFGLVSSIVEMRQAECAKKGIRIDSGLPISSVQVVADQAQLEQVFLSLLLHAEQTAATAESKFMSVVGRSVGKRVLVSISFSGSDAGTGDSPPAAGPFDARVCHALVQGHAGELRLLRDGDINKAEVDLPLYQPTTLGSEETQLPVRKAARAMTALLVEPDPALQRRLVIFLSAREHRVIPVETYDAALDAVLRFRFDTVLCADRIASASWVDFYQRIRRKVGSFVLATEIEQLETGPAFKSGDAYVLHKPVDDTELDMLLKTIESKEPARK
jgi:signal transduction histidine kinase